MFIISAVKAFLVKLVLGYSLQAVQVVVDCGQSLDKSVVESGCTEVDGKINADNFPSDGVENQKREVTIFLFWFGWFIHSENVLEVMKKAGYRPATLKELLALAKDYPELQRKFPIAELGTVCLIFGVVKKVVELSTRPDNKRAVKTELYARKWPDEYRFPAVKIVPPGAK